jgi:hypothetical protein
MILEYIMHVRYKLEIYSCYHTVEKTKHLKHFPCTDANLYPSDSSDLSCRSKLPSWKMAAKNHRSRLVRTKSRTFRERYVPDYGYTTIPHHIPNVTEKVKNSLNFKLF